MRDYQKVDIEINQQHIDLTIREEYKGYLISGINFFNIYSTKNQKIVKANVKTIVDAKDYIDALKKPKPLLL